MDLVNYLANLVTLDNTNALYVNPSNYDDYLIDKVDRTTFDNKVFVDTLDKLSFGNQSFTDALDIFLNLGIISYKNKRVIINKEEIKQLYFAELLDKEFADYITKSVQIMLTEWSYLEASGFVEYELETKLNEN